MRNESLMNAYFNPIINRNNVLIARNVPFVIFLSSIRARQLIYTFIL